LYRRHPDLFERAARLEEAASRRRREGGKSDITHTRIGGDWTLRDLEIQFRDQTVFFDDVQMDLLLEYKPCLCGL
jgi:hypothetical protein